MAPVIIPPPWELEKLSSTQRAQLAVDLLPSIEAEAKDRMRLANKGANTLPNGHYGRSLTIAARRIGVGERYISKAKKLRHDAPDLTEAMRDGRLTVNEAETIAARRNVNYVPRQRASPRKGPAQMSVTAQAALNSCKDLLLYDDIQKLAGGIPPEDRATYTRTLRGARLQLTRLIRELNQNESETP